MNERRSLRQWFADQIRSAKEFFENIIARVILGRKGYNEAYQMSLKNSIAEEYKEKKYSEKDRDHPLAPNHNIIVNKDAIITPEKETTVEQSTKETFKIPSVEMNKEIEELKQEINSEIKDPEIKEQLEAKIEMKENELSKYLNQPEHYKEMFLYQMELLNKNKVKEVEGPIARRSFEISGISFDITKSMFSPKNSDKMYPTFSISIPGEEKSRLTISKKVLYNEICGEEISDKKRESIDNFDNILKNRFINTSIENEINEFPDEMKEAEINNDFPKETFEELRNRLINLGIEYEFTDSQMDIISNNDFNYEQLSIIDEGLTNDLSFDDIEVFADPKLDSKKMELIKDGLILEQGPKLGAIYHDFNGNIEIIDNQSGIDYYENNLTQEEFFLKARRHELWLEKDPKGEVGDFCIKAIEHANFENMDLHKARFENCYMDDVNFSNVNLQDTTLNNSMIKNVSFDKNTNISGITYDSSDIECSKEMTMKIIMSQIATIMDKLSPDAKNNQNARIEAGNIDLAISKESNNDISVTVSQKQNESLSPLNKITITNQDYKKGLNSVQSCIEQHIDMASKISINVSSIEQMVESVEQKKSDIDNNIDAFSKESSSDDYYESAESIFQNAEDLYNEAKNNSDIENDEILICCDEEENVSY